MTDPEDKHFQLLLSEKELSDSQVRGFFDLHVKVLGFLGAAIVLLGWLYSDKPKPVGEQGLAIICLALVVLGCSVILQAIVFYGSSLGYLQYKMTRLNTEFAKLLKLSAPPFRAIWDWSASPAQAPVTVSIVALFGMHSAVTITLLYIAHMKGAGGPFTFAVIGASVYFIATLVAEVLMLKALRGLANHERS